MLFIVRKSLHDNQKTSYRNSKFKSTEYLNLPQLFKMRIIGKKKIISENK